MLLGQLRELATQAGDAPMLYSMQPVRYIIELDATGALVSPDMQDTTGGKPRDILRMELPRIRRSLDIKPFLLSDTIEYTLGVGREKIDPDRIAQYHIAYMRQLREAAQQTQDPLVQAVLTFLENDPLRQLQLPEDLDPQGAVAFRVDGVMPTTLPSVQRFWANLWDLAGQDDSVVMQCCVCGKIGPVLKRIQTSVKGVPGGQPTGTTMTSANERASEHYGLQATLTAPTCQSCADSYTKALNYMLAHREYRLDIGDTVLVCWTVPGGHPVDVNASLDEADSPPTDEPTFSLKDALFAPAVPDVSSLYKLTYKSGRGSRALALPRNYSERQIGAALLSAEGSRIRVHLVGSIALDQLRRNLVKWFAQQQLIGLGDTDEAAQSGQRVYGIPALAKALAGPSGQLRRKHVEAMISTALLGKPLPVDLLSSALHACRIRRPTQPLVTIIKMMLAADQIGSKAQSIGGVNTVVTKFDDTTTESPEGMEPLNEAADPLAALDESNTDPPYLLGRLLAVLDYLSWRATGSRNTLPGRSFNAACATPALMFPVLLRGSNYHLRKLQRDAPGAAIALRTSIDDLLLPVGSFPRLLGIVDQGRFILGYHHQRAASRARAAEAAREQATSESKRGRRSKRGAGDSQVEDSL